MEDMLADTLEISTSVVETFDGQLKSMEFESAHSPSHNHASNSDLSFHCNDEDVGDSAADAFFYPDGDSEYDDENEDDDNDIDDEYLYGYDDYSKMQAQFDSVDLPPGVEAPVAWLVDPNPPECSKAGIENSDVASCSKASNSTLKGLYEEKMDDVLRKLMYFKQFDIVEDYSDHYYKGLDQEGNHQPPKFWAKKIQDEWKILELNLPETIFVRAYESRMDLLRAAIIGPDGTPYHDGLFFFDVMFPSSYPHDPPLVHYHSGGLRLNPNLYHCGKVCLSLLGTWSGKTTELWLPDKSTMLQVLVSIQALILNSRPFFNEPGYESTYIGEEGENKCRSYNEEVFMLSLKTMMYSLKNPPKHFGDLVAGHFRIRTLDILTACRVYRDGAEVGSNTRDIVKQAEKAEDKNSAEFKSSLAEVVKLLTESFVKNGSKDCEKVQAE